MLLWKEGMENEFWKNNSFSDVLFPLYFTLLAIWVSLVLCCYFCAISAAVNRGFFYHKLTF